MCAASDVIVPSVEALDVHMFYFILQFVHIIICSLLIIEVNYSIMALEYIIVDGVVVPR